MNSNNNSHMGSCSYINYHQSFDDGDHCENDWGHGLIFSDDHDYSCLSLDQKEIKAESMAMVDNNNNNYEDEDEDDDDDEGKKKKKGKKMVNMGKRNSMALAKVAFQTRSDEDVLDDGFRWRKYGQKAVKHSTHPRSYYRCTHHTCNVKKQIQRHSKDPTIVVTTYEGIHNHPSEKFMETLTPLLKQLQFLSGI